MASLIFCSCCLFHTEILSGALNSFKLCKAICIHLLHKFCKAEQFQLKLRLTQKIFSCSCVKKQNLTPVSPRLPSFLQPFHVAYTMHESKWKSTVSKTLSHVGVPKEKGKSPTTIKRQHPYVGRVFFGFFFKEKCHTSLITYKTYENVKSSSNTVMSS